MLRRLSLVVALLGLSRCGGGTDGPATLIAPPVAAVDGVVFSTGGVNTVAGVSVGDHNGPGNTQGFFRFDIHALPPPSQIVSVTLHAYQFLIYGTPYASLGTLLVDHVDVGPALDSADHGAAPIVAGFTSFPSDPALGWRVVDVTARVLADLAAQRTTSDFRLRFSVANDGDGMEDDPRFNDGNDTAG